MFSGEGECVPFSNSLYPTGNVEDWLLEVENTMRGSLREILNRALLVYPEVKCYTVHHVNLTPLTAHSFTVYIPSEITLRLHLTCTVDLYIGFTRQNSRQFQDIHVATLSSSPPTEEEFNNRASFHMAVERY